LVTEAVWCEQLA